METSTNNAYLGYNTYILGTASSILNCLGIVVYNKSDLPEDTEKLSLYNIELIYRDIINSGISTTLIRTNASDSFKYIANGRGFNTIIYLSNADNSPIGYTEFLSIQGKERNINITLDFNSKISGDSTVDLVNSLSQLRNNTTIERVFTGNKLYDYPTIKTIKEEVEEAIINNPNYTTHLSSIIKSKNNQNIYLKYGILNGENLIKLDFSKNINIDPFGFGFQRFQLGYYKTDIVIYSWKDLDYSIYSTIKRNRFDNPISYINTSSGHTLIPKYTNSEDVRQVINYFAGKYAVIKLSGSINKILLYDIEKQNWVNLENDFIIDQLDINSRIIELPTILTYDNISKYLPEIDSIYLDLKDYVNVNSIKFYGKIGDWIIINRDRDDLIVYTNMSKTIYLRSDEIPIIINEDILMIHTKENNLDYYTIYNNPGTYYSEKARTILEDTTTNSITYKPEYKYSENLNIMFCTNGFNDELYKNYYETEKILVVHSSESLINSYFSSFRKNNLPNNSTKIPEIIGSIGGLLYYISNNKYLNYL